MNLPSKDETTTPHVSSSHSRAAPRPERYHVPGIVLPTVQTGATIKRYSPVIVGTEFLVCDSVGEHVPDDHNEGVLDRDDSLQVAGSVADSSVFGGKVTGLG